MTFQKKMASRVYKQYYARIKENIYPVLMSKPFFGPNIKCLQGELSSIYRYRIGDYRLFYSIDSKEKFVFVTDFDNRKDVYR